MILDTLFSLLQSASFGACAVSLDQRILLWNRAAERILGHSSREVVGRRCYDVMVGRGLTPECAGGCSSIRYVRSGLIPPPTRVLMLRSSGERMWVSVTPAVISGGPEGGPLLLYFFEDGRETESSGSAADSIWEVPAAGGTEAMSNRPEALLAPGETSTLSRRELEVLRLVALGWETTRIAVQLGISPHTVRNHIRNLRNKLKASTKLDAVLKGLRLGIISVGGSPQ